MPAMVAARVKCAGGMAAAPHACVLKARSPDSGACVLAKAKTHGRRAARRKAARCLGAACWHD
eukprot:9000809-Alexandrium_andersonii.AAC.1